jgi:hypothetical protein
MLCTMCMHGIMTSRAWEHCGEWNCTHILNCPRCGVRRYVVENWHERSES